MEIDHRLGFKFSYAATTNSGKKKVLLDVANGKRGVTDGIDVVNNFPIVYRWYELIGDANGLETYDPLVAEAYWLGSTLLDRNFDYNEIHSTIINNFPEAFRDRKRPEVPNGRPPHHNLHVNTYGIVSRPQSTDEEIESCKVSPVMITKDTNFGENLYTEERLKLENPFGYDIRQEEVVAVHHNVICAVLDEAAEDNLARYGFDLQRSFP